MDVQAIEMDGEGEGVEEMALEEVGAAAAIRIVTMSEKRVSNREMTDVI